MTPSLAVVIPVHGTGSTLGRAVRSVRQQRGVDIELIVVDDGSPATGALAAAATADLGAKVVHQARRGVSAARNRGASEASADLLTFLDSDDEVSAGWAHAIVARAEPGIELVSCRGTRISSDGQTELYPEDLGPAFLGLRARFLAGAFAMSTGLFRDVGGYDERLRFGENTELGLRLAAALDGRGTAAATVDEALVVWHAERRRTYAPLDLLQAAELTLEEHATALARDPVLLADHHAIAGVNAARVRDLRSARTHLRAAAATNPSIRAWGRAVAAHAPGVARRIWGELSASPWRATPPRPRPLAADPLISVIIACQNGGDDLVNQSRAVAQQLSGTGGELILADSGSTDEAVELALDRCAGVAKRVDASDRPGDAHARNVGAASARGDVLLFVDKFDLVGAGWLVAMARALAGEPFVAGRLDDTLLNSAEAQAAHRLAQAAGLHDWALFPWAHGCSLGIDRDLFDAVGGFDESLRTAEDIDLCYRIQERFDVRLRLADLAVIHHRVRESPRATFRQGRAHGSGGPEIYLRHRRYGDRAQAIGGALRQSVSSLRDLVLGAPDDRRRALFGLGARVGRLEASLRLRTWYP